MKKKVFITGEAGSIGSALIEEFSKDVNYEVINNSERCKNLTVKIKNNLPFVFDYDYNGEIDITSGYILDTIFGQFRPDIIIHTAAAVGTDKCEKDFEEAYRINVDGIRRLAESVKKHVPDCLFVNFSTTATMDPEDYNCEKGIDIKTIRSPKTWYGATKYIGEIIAKFSFKNCITFLPVFLFGKYPIDTSSVFPKIFVSSLMDNKFPIKLDPAIYKQYEYLPNVVPAIKRIIENPESVGKDIVICGEERHQFSYHIEKAEKAYINKFGEELYYELQPKEDYCKHHVVSNETFKKMLRYAKITKEEFYKTRKPFEEAIFEVAESVPENARLL